VGAREVKDFGVSLPPPGEGCPSGQEGGLPHAKGNASYLIAVAIIPNSSTGCFMVVRGGSINSAVLKSSKHNEGNIIWNFEM